MERILWACLTLLHLVHKYTLYYFEIIALRKYLYLHVYIVNTRWRQSILSTHTKLLKEERVHFRANFMNDSNFL